VIFVDTGFLAAHISEEDKNHARVEAVLDGYRGRRIASLLLTTNHVVAETVTLVKRRSHRDPRVRHQLAVSVGRLLFAGAFGRIHHATPEDEREAFVYFERHGDKRYSFADCLSFVIMERYGIHEAWAVDEDFTHRFHTVPGPLKKKASPRREA
jgi:predicted nucleic acid-binding protein